jgi:hypothetical protein
MGVKNSNRSVLRSHLTNGSKLFNILRWSACRNHGYEKGLSIGPLKVGNNLKASTEEIMAMEVNSFER